MGTWEIALIVLCSAIVVGVIVSRIVKRVKGKPPCDCGCDCSHCSGCTAKEPPTSADKK